MLALSSWALSMFVAMPGRSQTTPDVEGPHRRSHISPDARLAEPGAPTAETKDLAALHYKIFTIGPERSPYAVAGSINNAGPVTGYCEETDSVFHGFVWQEGELMTVIYPGAFYTLLYGVNSRGAAIGYYNDGTADHVVTYDARSGAWGTLPDIPGYPLHQGYGINDAGFAVGNALSSTAAVA